MNIRLVNLLIVSSNQASGEKLLARTAGLAVAVTAALATTPAHAQQVSSTEEAPALQEIVVTAEKRSESLQNAPAAITVVSEAELQESGAVSLPGLSNLFPSARIEQFIGSAHLFVRGIGAEQDRVTVDQLVNVFVDGVVLPREMVAASQSDVAAIELLPGPQGTLYGASSVGGVLNVRNHRPTRDNENHLFFEYGNYASLHFTDVQNISVNDGIALRGSVDYVNHSAYETTGRWTANTLNARLGALITPSDSFSAYIWAQAYNDNSISPEFGVTNENGQWIPRHPWDTRNDCATVACNGAGDRPLQPPQTLVSHDYIVAGQFDWHLKGMTLTDIASFLNVDMDEHVASWIFTGLRYQAKEHQLTNELKLASDAGAPLQWLGGLYVYQNRADSLVTFANYEIPHYELRNVGPYAQMTYSFTDNFRATAGGRYTWTRKEGAFTAPNVLPETSATWSNVDWKVGVEYDLTPSTMTYLTAQTGSSPGTLDPSNVIDGRPNITRLTRLGSLTAGWKSELLGSRLQLNNEIFYYNYKDFLIQTVVCSNTPACLPYNTVYLNAPKMISVGDQLDLRWLVTAHDAVHVGYAFTSAKTSRWITDSGADLSHQTLMEAPQNTVTVGGQHIFDLRTGGRLIFRVDSYMSTGYWADFETQPGTPVHLGAEHQAGYSTTNLALTYHSALDNWTLGLWARNLENTAQLGPSSAFAPGSFKNVAGLSPIAGIPRTYGAQFTLHVPTGL